MQTVTESNGEWGCVGPGEGRVGDRHNPPLAQSVLPSLCVFSLSTHSHYLCFGYGLCGLHSPRGLCTHVLNWWALNQHNNETMGLAASSTKNPTRPMVRIFGTQ